MNRSEVHKVDYDSPLKYFDFLTFEDFSIDEDVCEEKQEYFNIKLQIYNTEKVSYNPDSYNLNLKGILQSLKITKAEKQDKMIDFLFHGLPRCYLDSKLFDFSFIDKDIFREIINTHADHCIISKIECLIGKRGLDIIDDDAFGEYYIVQCYKNAKQCSVLKKLIINWKDFDPSFYIFRKLNYLNKKGTEYSVFGDSLNDLDYYLNVWLINYLKHEIYYLKFLVYSMKNTQYKNTKFYLFNKTIINKEIKHQKEELNRIFESSKNPYVFECNKVAFYWRKQHLRKYYSSLSFENTNEVSKIESIKTYTFRDNPFKEQNVSNFKIASFKQNLLDLFKETPYAELDENKKIIKNVLSTLENDLENQILTKNRFNQCKQLVSDMSSKDKFKSRANFLVNILGAESNPKENIDFEDWPNNFEVFKVLVLKHLIRCFYQKSINKDHITHNKENVKTDDEWIRFESVKTHENDLIDDIKGSDSMKQKLHIINEMIYEFWKFVL